MPESEVLEGQVADEEVRHLPAVASSNAIVARDEITVEELTAQKDKIVQVMDAVMTPEVHYGVIPGTNKPSLLKPGAEAILVALRLAPHYESEKIFTDDGHLTVAVKCELRHITTGLVIATGEGLCTSRESKYAWRKQKRACPACGAEAIIKGKAEYGGGWVCWKKADVPGCGAKYDDGDPAIEQQVEAKIVNPDLPDTWNTVLKMADKRALVAAVLNGTAASDVFTQDTEDSHAAREQAAAETRRQDRPAHPVPKGWADLEKDIRRVDNGTEAWALFQAFTRAASYHLHGETDTSKLKKAQKDVLWQKAAGVDVWLHENVDYDGAFYYFDEAAIRNAWAHMLDGHRLEIPDYAPPEPEGAQEALAELRADVLAAEGESPKD